jgi:DUF438 domain-containing protein
MKVDQSRIHNLIEYTQGIMNKEDGTELYMKYRSDIEQVTPQEVFEIFYSMLQKGTEPKDILVFLDKVINVFYKSLIGYSWKKPEENSFVGFLMQENHAMIKKLEDIKEILKDKDYEARRDELIPKVKELMEFKDHYLKKENILFPFLERKLEKFNGLAIMWAMHDETRLRMKKVIDCLESEDCRQTELSMELGNLFFAMHGLVKKEELILFPSASEVINENEWNEMLVQSLDYKFPFIQRPKQQEGIESAAGEIGDFIGDFKEGCQFKTDTGVLDFEQIVMVFNALPVDLTFVDENNKVRFFTKPKDRLFPRSAAIIGRDVDKCHPPQSVHVVHKIIEAFKAGTKDDAKFWINLKGKTILIQYFALRDSAGRYKGVLEVSQDISEIKSLEGEKRLLHWE